MKDIWLDAAVADAHLDPALPVFEAMRVCVDSRYRRTDLDDLSSPYVPWSDERGSRPGAPGAVLPEHSRYADAPASALNAETRAYWARHADSPMLPVGVILHRNATPRLLSEIFTRWDALPRLARHQYVSDSLVYLAANPNTPPEVLTALYLTKKFVPAHDWLAANPNTHPGLLKRISSGGGGNRRWRVLDNPSTPEHIAERLIANGTTVPRPAWPTLGPVAQTIPQCWSHLAHLAGTGRRKH